MLHCWLRKKKKIKKWRLSQDFGSRLKLIVRTVTRGKLVLIKHPGYRSLLAWTPTIYTRAGQSKHRVPPAPIKTPERSSGGQMRILFTHLITSFRRLFFPYTFILITNPAMAIVQFWFRDIETWLGFLFLEQKWLQQLSESFSKSYLLLRKSVAVYSIHRE